MDDRRTDSARENDDSDIIDSIEPTPSQGGRSGGNLQSDIATEASLERVRDPEAHQGVQKQTRSTTNRKAILTSRRTRPPKRSG